MNQDASILIVEDEADLRDSLRFTLKRAGYRVLTAGDGFEALSILQTQPVNLILSDIVMPRMNGYEFYKRLRQEPGWITIPFIFLSIRNWDSDLRFGKELGVNDYLVKPIEAADLLASIQGNLRRAQQILQAWRPDACSAPSTSCPKPQQGIITLGRVRIALQQYQAWLDNEILNLSGKEFKLLSYLAQRAGQVITIAELIQATHDLKINKVQAGLLLRPLISSLRRKLGYPAGDAGCIIAVRGVGYRLITPNI